MNIRRRFRILLSISALSILWINQPVSSANNSLEVHFIDVGQGDSILLHAVNEDIAILIDAGDFSSGQAVVSYLQKAGITKIDHLIATHPHADHIGGLPAVIKAFPIGEMYMPRTTHTTQTYENLLLSIKEKGLRITEAKAGMKLIDRDNLQATFVGPVSSGYDNLNNYSAVLLVKYYNTQFLFTGDAESESEQQILMSGVSKSRCFKSRPPRE